MIEWIFPLVVLILIILCFSRITIVRQGDENFLFMDKFPGLNTCCNLSNDCDDLQENSNIPHQHYLSSNAMCGGGSSAKLNFRENKSRKTLISNQNNPKTFDIVNSANHMVINNAVPIKENDLSPDSFDKSNVKVQAMPCFSRNLEDHCTLDNTMSRERKVPKAVKATASPSNIAIFSNDNIDDGIEVNWQDTNNGDSVNDDFESNLADYDDDMIGIEHKTDEEQQTQVLTDKNESGSQHEYVRVATATPNVSELQFNSSFSESSDSLPQGTQALRNLKFLTPENLQQSTISVSKAINEYSSAKSFNSTENRLVLDENQPLKRPNNQYSEIQVIPSKKQKILSDLKDNENYSSNQSHNYDSENLQDKLNSFTGMLKDELKNYLQYSKPTKPTLSNEVNVTSFASMPSNQLSLFPNGQTNYLSLQEPRQYLDSLSSVPDNQTIQCAYQESQEHFQSVNSSQEIHLNPCSAEESQKCFVPDDMLSNHQSHLRPKESEQCVLFNRLASKELGQNQQGKSQQQFVQFARDKHSSLKRQEETHKNSVPFGGMQCTESNQHGLESHPKFSFGVKNKQASQHILDVSPSQGVPFTTNREPSQFQLKEPKLQFSIFRDMQNKQLSHQPQESDINPISQSSITNTNIQRLYARGGIQENQLSLNPQPAASNAMSYTALDNSQQGMNNSKESKEPNREI